MKKLIIALAVLFLCFNLAAIKTGKSIFYSDSYMLRARGVEAAYWNPANLMPTKNIDIWLPAANTGIQVSNNALDLDTYNSVVGDEYLDQAEKDALLNKIEGSLQGSFSGNHSIFGLTLGNMAFASSASYMGKTGISKRYLELLLNGNADSLYVFDNKSNQVSATSYVDFTYGMGNLTLPLGEKIPPIRAGFSASILVGFMDGYTQRFEGYLSSTMDGISMHQDVTLRTGVGGFGFKSMLGLASQPYPGLDVGLTVDNIFGALKWSGKTEDRIYGFHADSVYVSNINDDFYTQTDETIDIDSYTTSLPPELRLAAMYTLSQLSISADYVQGFKNSVITDNTGRLAFGAEISPIPILRLHTGLGLGNSSYPWRISYGFSLRSSTLEGGLSVQSFQSVFPGTKSKGIAFGSFIRLWI
ncbi:MAG: hypothetical protein KA984_04615 [Candidatus Cloacimonetes bacterium]|nr:hypothetical protein [Candidatus Cloacimonadota bacterium]